MIQKLRWKITLLVISVLLVVSVGIVVAINEMNAQNIASQAESALDVLMDDWMMRNTQPMGEAAMNEPPPLPAGNDRDNETPPPIPSGEGQPDETPPPLPAGPMKESEAGTEDAEARSSFRPDAPAGDAPPEAFSNNNPMLRGRGLSREEVANLSNYYILRLDQEGNLTSWESARADLYTETELQSLADQVLESGQTRGRMDTQFFRLLDPGDNIRVLIVLDARLEMLAGQNVLRSTILVAAIACGLLSLGAWFLIRRMIRPVEEAFRKQQQFVWDASHELKTPLAVISANADVLEADIGQNEYLGYIRSEVRRTDSLVKNLLTLARMDRGTVGQDLTRLNISEALLEVLLPFESTVFEEGKKLETEVQEEVYCTGNKGMLQQLAVILLSNAMKYSDDHGTIRVRLEKKNRGAELRVENTGEGIAAEDLERIFDRFYRTDASRNSETGGEGLGLAIAKSIVEIHHGRIWAESVPGKNAVFVVDLP